MRNLDVIIFVFVFGLVFCSKNTVVDHVLINITFLLQKITIIKNIKL